MTSLEEIARRKRQTARLFFVMGTLVLFHLLSVFLNGRSWQVERMFSLDLEANIPTWFSSLVLALSAWVAYDCSKWSLTLKQQKIWRVVAIFFLFLSCDEIAMLHENLGRLFEKYVWLHAVDSKVLSAFNGSTWVLMLSPLIAIIILWLIGCFRQCLDGSSNASRFLTLGFLLMVAGGIGLDFSTNFIGWSNSNWIGHGEVVFEELFEMAGEIFILLGLITHQEKLLKDMASIKPAALESRLKSMVSER